jgi:hypothetical protein
MINSKQGTTCTHSNVLIQSGMIYMIFSLYFYDYATPFAM